MRASRPMPAPRSAAARSSHRRYRQNRRRGQPMTDGCGRPDNDTDVTLLSDGVGRNRAASICFGIYLGVWVDQPTTRDRSATAFLAGGGELGALVRAKDWSATPVGPVDRWPQSLRNVVQIMLGSRYAMWMGWGRERTFFYNDAYRPTLGSKHPWALGSPASDVWAEIWPAIGPRVETVERRGEATWDEGLLLFLERHGYPEETYHTFSYSPLPDDEGGIGGMLCVVTEETERIIGERRLRILREVAA